MLGEHAGGSFANGWRIDPEVSDDSHWRRPILLTDAQPFLKSRQWVTLWAPHAALLAQNPMIMRRRWSSCNWTEAPPPNRNHASCGPKNSRETPTLVQLPGESEPASSFPRSQCWGCVPDEHFIPNELLRRGLQSHNRTLTIDWWQSPNAPSPLATKDSRGVQDFMTRNCDDTLGPCYIKKASPTEGGERSKPFGRKFRTGAIPALIVNLRAKRGAV